MLDVRTAPPILAEHEWAMPDLYHTATRPSTAELFSALAHDGATVDEAIDATRSLLS